jgi:hypothetical protein
VAELSLGSRFFQLRRLTPEDQVQGLREVCASSLCLGEDDELTTAASLQR